MCGVSAMKKKDRGGWCFFSIAIKSKRYSLPFHSFKFHPNSRLQLIQTPDFITIPNLIHSRLHDFIQLHPTSSLDFIHLDFIHPSSSLPCLSSPLNGVRSKGDHFTSRSCGSSCVFSCCVSHLCRAICSCGPFWIWASGCVPDRWSQTCVFFWASCAGQNPRIVTCCASTFPCACRRVHLQSIGPYLAVRSGILWRSGPSCRSCSSPCWSPSFAWCRPGIPP